MAKKSASDSKKTPAVGKPLGLAHFDGSTALTAGNAQCKQGRPFN